MEQEPRKASDILLELENKVNVLLGLLRAQDLTIKVLSNKLNSLMEKMDKQGAVPSKIMVEAVNSAPLPTPFNQMPSPDPEKSIPVSADFNLQVEDKPNGFRRTSRPETYAGDNSYLPARAKISNADSSPFWAGRGDSAYTGQ